MTDYFARVVRRPGPGTLVTVVGLARSGVAASRWLLRLGCLVRVTEAGQSPQLAAAAEELIALGAAVELGKHSRDFVEGSELVVVSPGVPLEAQPVQWARAQGIPVVGELELGSWYCAGSIVAITGSNGKSTVVTLVGEMLRAAGKEVVVCGNIGRPLCDALSEIQLSTTVVLEVSSFQLENTLSFYPQVGTVLNLTTNHMDRHGSFARYRAAKGRLFAFQNTQHWALLNADEPGAAGLRSLVRGQLALFSRKKRVLGAFAADHHLELNLPEQSGEICRRDQLPYPAPHHEENALAAACMAGLMGVEPQVCGEVLRSFQGLPHRQQLIAKIKGVAFVNDSKATTVDAGIKAIRAAAGSVVLIAGGRDKGSDFTALRACGKKLKAAVLIGEDGPKIAAALKGATRLLEAADLPGAVQLAFDLARSGESVLLSPMCTSFDMFRDFEERGERFAEAVEELKCAH